MSPKAVGVGASPVPLRDGDPVVRLPYEHLRRQVPVLTVPRDLRKRPLDAEAVHRIRVATRRARSAMRMFRDVLPNDLRSAFDGELEWLAGVLGDVRDLDVYREHYQAYRAGIPKRDAKALIPYEQYLTEEWEKAAAGLTQCLQSARYDALVSGLASAVASGAPPAALTQPGALTIRSAGAKYIEAAKNRVLKRGRRIDSRSAPEKLHALRKEGKRFRYLLEFFEEFFGGRLTAARRAAMRLQDVLGEYQDAVSATERLRAYVERCEGAAGPGELLALGQLIASQRRSGEKARKRFGKEWRELEGAVSGLALTET